MTVSAQLADARMPARMIHKGRFWGNAQHRPRHDLAPAWPMARRVRLDEQRPGSSSPVPSASSALTADLAKVRVTQKQNGSCNDNREHDSGRFVRR